MQMLKKIRLAGWKSIQDQTIDLQPLNIMIGGNGAGKSNLISFFKLLNAMFAQQPALQEFIGTAGGADAVLHFGSRRTPVAEIELVFDTVSGQSSYYARWAAAAMGTLVFAEERCEFLQTGHSTPQVVQLGAGHTESRLNDCAAGQPSAGVLLGLLRRCHRFHFHDTSERSAIRGPSYIHADRFLYPDGGNLASMLYLYQQTHPAVYRRIVASIRQVIPDVAELILEPQRLSPNDILLKWRQQGRDYEFGPHQLSDGSLRFIALTTLLLQPADSSPLLIALDEPELGLHPAALGLLTGMARSASMGCQLLLATQSPVLLDGFDPADVLVVDNQDGASQFRRLTFESLREWLDDYTLSEIWEKKVIAGGPY